MKQRDGFVAGVLGVVAGLLIVVIFQLQGAPGAAGQTAAATSPAWLMATSTTQGAAVVFLFDIDQKRLGTYVMKGPETLELVGTRTITQEFSAREYGRGMRPSYDEIKKTIDRAGSVPKK